MLDITEFLNNGIKALIFDLDGTLADTMPIHMKAWLRAGLLLNIPVTEKDILRLTGAPTREVATILIKEYGWKADPDEIAEAKQKFYLEEKASHGKVMGIPAVHALVNHFYKKMPMAVGTGSGRVNALSTISDIGLTDIFDAVITASDVTNPKPHPETFLKCSEIMKIAPANCLVFEDGDMGIKAAIEGGMQYFDVRPYLGIA